MTPSKLCINNVYNYFYHAEQENINSSGKYAKFVHYFLVQNILSSIHRKNFIVWPDSRIQFESVVTEISLNKLQ